MNAVILARDYFAHIGGQYGQAVYVALEGMDPSDPEAVEYAAAKLAEWQAPCPTREGSRECVYAAGHEVRSGMPCRLQYPSDYR